MSLADRLDKLEPRERTLLMGLGAALAGIVLLVIPGYLYASVGGLRDQNQEIRDYLQRVVEQGDKIARKKAARDALTARYNKKMPALASFVEDAASSAGVDISDTTAKPDVPHGKKYTEHVVSVRLKKAGLLGIAKMLEKIEQSGYPVSVGKLRITPRAGEPDNYDVEMQVSAFERKAEPKKETKTEDTPEEGDEP